MDGLLLDTEAIYVEAMQEARAALVPASYRSISAIPPPACRVPSAIA